MHPPALDVLGSAPGGTRLPVSSRQVHVCILALRKACAAPCALGRGQRPQAHCASMQRRALGTRQQPLVRFRGALLVQALVLVPALLAQALVLVPALFPCHCVALSKKVVNLVLVVSGASGSHCVTVTLLCYILYLIWVPLSRCATIRTQCPDKDFPVPTTDTYRFAAPVKVLI